MAERIHELTFVKCLEPGLPATGYAPYKCLLSTKPTGSLYVQQVSGFPQRDGEAGEGSPSPNSI